VLAGRATRESTRALAGQIADASGARLLAQTHTPRISRGAGRVAVERIPYPVGAALAALADVQNVILVGAKAPVAFFAYPDQPSRLTPPDARIVELARIDEDIPYALEALRDGLGASAPPATAELRLPERPGGAITPEKIGALLGAALPENAIVIDESITTGRNFLSHTRTARPHEWLLPTGGAIGYALPCAVGAAVACPERRVVVLESDGSGLYMPQALWTMAREGLDVLTLVFANRRYEILRGEMRNVGVDAVGANAAALLDLNRPAVDWVAMARGFGVEAFRATTMDELSRCFDAGLALDGPSLIEVVL
jgi:acetolactate synthase-1/2/3 large subunit